MPPFTPDPPLSASPYYTAAPTNLVRPDPPAAATMDAPPPADRVTGITDELKDQFLEDVINGGGGSGATGGLPDPTRSIDTDQALQEIVAEITRLRAEVRELQSHFGPSRVLIAKMDRCT